MRDFKYLQKMFFLLVMTVSCAGFMACDSDDPEPIEEPEPETDHLIGIWKRQSTSGSYISYYCFREDMTGYKWTNEDVYTKHNFLYVYNKETGDLQLTYTEDGEVKNRKVISCDATTLKITNADEGISTYTRTDKEPEIPEPDKKFDPNFYSGEINGHKYVDLGLSVKWATCNVGVAYPSGCGNYYAWGETEIQEEEKYAYFTYKWNKWNSTIVTKYCTNSENGTVDNRTTLEPSDDVATVEWGNYWRIPTQDELEELCDKCTWILITHGGENGYKVIGPNGNSIFLPMTGFCYLGSELNPGFGYYWSATLDESDNERAHELFIGIDEYKLSYSMRWYGHSVRPVCD